MIQQVTDDVFTCCVGKIILLDAAIALRQGDCYTPCNVASIAAAIVPEYERHQPHSFRH